MTDGVTIVRLEDGILFICGREEQSNYQSLVWKVWILSQQRHCFLW